MSAYQEKAVLYIFTSDGSIVHQRRIKDTVPWMRLNGLSPEGDYVAAEGRNSENEFDPMLEQVYPGLQDDSLVNDREPEAIENVEDIEAYNKLMGRAGRPSFARQSGLREGGSKK